MVNRKGGRGLQLGFVVPDGWMIIKQHRGITTIRPINNNVHSPSITIKKGQGVGVGL